MRGSITRVSRKDRSSCILAEDGNEVYFEVLGHAATGLRVSG